MIGFSPHSLEEALEIRTAHPEAVPVAGGTDLMVEMNSARIKPAALLDLSRIDELREWSCVNGTAVLGAGVTFARIEREARAFSALAQAAHGRYRADAHHPRRNAGTGHAEHPGARREPVPLHRVGAGQDHRRRARHQ